MLKLVTSGVVVPERHFGKHFGAGVTFQYLFCNQGGTLLLQYFGKYLPRFNFACS